MSRSETYSFGEWVQQRREALHLTQRALAAAAHCSVPMLKKIEGDQRRPSPELAQLLAAALKVPAASQADFVAAARGERTVEALWALKFSDAQVGFQAFAPPPLPDQATTFIGRTDELGAIRERLREAGCRLLTLLGPGGIGKTRLAVKAAALQAAGEAAWPAVFVPLAAITEAVALPDAVARSLRLNLTGPTDQLVVSFLRHVRVLLILDNCEQLAGDLGWLATLLAEAPGVKVLATSRERLRLAEEWVYAVPNLAQAEALFVERARQVTPAVDAAAEQAAIQRICALVEQHPLAVELAAGWTPLLTCGQIADQLARNQALLTTDLRNVPERHRSLQAVCDHSWNLLTASEQAALRRLSVFRGGWQAAQAEAVAGANLPMLRRLTDKSLVRVSGGRFELHELIRQDAARRLTEAGEEAAARDAHFAAYQALAAQLDAAQFGSDGLVAIARFDQEQGNLRAALAWSLEAGQAQAGLQLMSHLWFYWTRRGAYREGSEWAQRALRQAPDRDSLPLCLTLSGAAVLNFISGHFAEAQALAQRTLEIARRLEDPEALISAYGLATFASTSVEEALEALHAALHLSEVTGKSPELRPLLYQGAATWLHSSGRLAEARAYYEKSVALFRSLGVLDLASDPLGQLGQLALQEGRLQAAYDLTVESITAARSSGYDVAYGAWGGARLGQIQLYQGDLEGAQRSLEAALAWQQADPAYDRTRQETLALLSEAALARGDVDAAVAHMQANLALCERFYHELQAADKLRGGADSLPVELVGLCVRLGLLAEVQGELERAVTLFGASAGLTAQSGLRLVPPLAARVAESEQSLRAALGEARFVAAYDAGSRLSSAEAFALVLGMA